MTSDEIHVGSIVTGPLLPEPVEVLAVVPLGESIKLIGKGCKTGLIRDPVLTPRQLTQLRCSPLRESVDGDPALFRQGSRPITAICYSRRVAPIPCECIHVVRYYHQDRGVA
jgi:hypothetical protein